MESNNPPLSQPLNARRQTGIIKQWNAERRFGIIYAPEGRRYFLHLKNVVEGVPELGRRVLFDLGEARSATELLPAVNVVVGEVVGAPR